MVFHFLNIAKYLMRHLLISKLFLIILPILNYFTLLSFFVEYSSFYSFLLKINKITRIFMHF